MLLQSLLLLLVCICACAGDLCAQDLAGIKIHGFLTQGFLYSSNNNYLTMKTSEGSAQWTDGAVSVSDAISEKLRVGIQLHVYQLGDLGGSHLQIDWASADYRFNDHFGIRAGKVKTVIGLFNDSQDVDSIFLWILLPQSSYPVDNKSFFLSHEGGDVYGMVPLGKRAGRIIYDGFVGYNGLDLHGGFVKQMSQYGLIFRAAPSGKTYGGDLHWEAPLRGLTVGASADVSALDGSSPQGGMHVAPYLITGEYAAFARKKIYFAAEYDRTPATAVLTLGTFAIPVPQDLRSWYVMGSYRVTKRFQAGSYYSHFVNKALDTTQAANYAKDWVVSGRYDFNTYFYGKIEGHFLHGTVIGYYSDTNPGGLRPQSNMLAVKAGFSF